MTTVKSTAVQWVAEEPWVSGVRVDYADGTHEVVYEHYADEHSYIKFDAIQSFIGLTRAEVAAAVKAMMPKRVDVLITQKWNSAEEVLDSLRLIAFERGNRMDVHMRNDSFVYVYPMDDVTHIIAEFHNLDNVPYYAEGVKQIVDMAEEAYQAFEGKTKHIIF